MNHREPPSHGGVPVDFDPFWGPVVETGAPSTEAQREIWLALRLDPDARSAFNECAALTFTGPLNREALTLALRDVVNHHDALRIIFSDDGLSLAFAVPFDPPLAFHDLTSNPHTSIEANTDAILRDNSGTPFDMRLGPLVRFVLIRQSASKHLLAITAHHIVCDGWSMGVLVKDLGEAYSARARGEAPSLGVAQSFAEYARSRALFETSEERNQSLDYWKRVLAHPPEPLELPYSGIRPAVRSYRSERIDFQISLANLEAAKKSAARCRVTFSTFILGALSGFFSRVCNQSDLVVGLPAAEQALLALPRLVGHCANLLPIRLVLDPNAPCTSLMTSASEGINQGFEHARVSLGSILERLHLPRDPSRAPLVALMCNVDKTPAPKDCCFVGLETTYKSIPRSSENFELSFNALESSEGLVLETQFNSDLFSRKTTAHLLECFDHFFTELVRNPARPLSEIPLLSRQGAICIRDQWNATEKQFAHSPTATALHDLLFKREDFAPHESATEDGIGSLTYGEVDQISTRLAHTLRAIGVNEGSYVGIMFSRDRFLPARILGVLRAGAAYVPLDPTHPDERLRGMIADSGIGLVISDSSLHTRALSVFDKVLNVAVEKEGIDFSAPLPQLTSTERPAYAIFTSGSTGRPKAVAVPHRAVVNFLQAVKDRPGINRSDKMLALTTVGFDISVLELFLPLLSGSTVYIAPTEHALNPKALETTILTSKITMMQATPSTWRMLIAHGWKGQNTLKALTGGESLPSDLAESLIPRVGSLWNMYGPTETTVWSSCARITSPSPITVGTPLANTTFSITDNRGAPVPIGAKGELCIAGLGVTTGYINRKDLTDEKFVLRENHDGSPVRVYRTGDIARWNWDGSVELFGRSDSQVKVRGFRIEIGEIESAIRTHAAVRDTVVTVREDSPGDQRIVAYIVCSGSVAITASELRTFLRKTLPDYMIPQHVIALDCVPLSPSGKVNRRELPAPFIVQEPRASQPPRTKNEIILGRVWAALLRKPTVDVHDNFFSIGGHSLLALQVISAIERETGYTIPVRSMLLRTLEQIALEIPNAIEEQPVQQSTVAHQGGSMLQRLRSMFRQT